MPRSPPPPNMRRGRQGSPHPEGRRKRQGSPHPNAIPGHVSPGSASPSKDSVSGPFPNPTHEAAQDRIPDFVSMAPAIFVPATFDYTQPRPSTLPPSGAAETRRVDRALAELEEHMDAVKRNIATMVLQQARKVRQDAVQQERAIAAQGLPPPRSKRLPPTRADEDALLRNLGAPRDPRRTYGVGRGFGPHDVPQVLPNPKDTPREAAVTMLVDWMRYGALQMEGYEMHCETARKQTRDRVAREVAMESGDADGVPMDLD